MSDEAEYRVALDAYNGPLDLLLFLIQRDEIDIYDIPIARITSQYVEYVDLLQVLDPEAAGQFLVLAATLMEIKSRTLLPKPPPEEIDEEMVDPRLELVHQLLEYKRFKDAARSLDDAAREQAFKHARRPVLPDAAPDEYELDNLDIWDLFEAFNKLLKQIGKAGTAYRVEIDDTPLALHADDILDSIGRAGGAQEFEEIFLGRTKAEMIGLFLALLELIRQHRIRARQDRPFSTIFIELLDTTPITVAEETFAPAENVVDGPSQVRNGEAADLDREADRQNNRIRAESRGLPRADVRQDQDGAPPAPASDPPRDDDEIGTGDDRGRRIGATPEPINDSMSPSLERTDETE